MNNILTATNSKADGNDMSNTVEQQMFISN